MTIREKGTLFQRCNLLIANQMRILGWTTGARSATLLPVWWEYSGGLPRTSPLDGAKTSTRDVGV